MRGDLVKQGVVQLFLATGTCDWLCLANRSGVAPSLRPGAACNPDQGFFHYVGFFFAVLGSASSCCAASLSLCCRKQRSEGLVVPGHGHRRMRDLVCLVAVLQSSYPQLYCIPACIAAPTSISLGSSSPLSQLPYAVTLDSEENLLAELVTHPGAFFFCRKFGAFVIFLLHLPLPIQTLFPT